MEDGITAINDVKGIIGINFLGTIGDLKLDSATAANCTLKGKRDHVYGEIYTDHMYVKIVSHVKVTSSNPASNI